MKRPLKSRAFLVPVRGQGLLWAVLEKGVPAAGGGWWLCGGEDFVLGRGPRQLLPPPCGIRHCPVALAIASSPGKLPLGLASTCEQKLSL